MILCSRRKAYLVRLTPRRTFLELSVLATTGVLLPPSLMAQDPDSDDWLSHGWDARQTRHNPRESIIGPDTVSRLRLRWEFDAGSGITGTPAVVGNRVIAGSWDGRIYALDRTSGRLLWTFDAGVRAYPPNRKLGVFASPAVSGRTVYIASDRLIALNLESGKLLWERIVGDPERTHEYFWAPPLFHEAKVYAGVSGGSESDTRARLVCVDAASGVLRWTFFIVASDVAGGALIAPPSVDPGTKTLYASTGSPFRLRPGPLRYSCSLIALDAVTGKLRWADQVHPHDTRNLDLNCPPMLITALRGGRRARLIVVGGKDGIRAWDRSTRKRLWHVQLTPSPPLGPPAAASRTQDKTTQETQHATTGPEFGPTAAADGLVFLASNNNADKSCLIAALEAGSGEIRWLRCLPAFQLGPISVANGIVYLGLVDGKVRAWRAKDGELLWESPQGQPIAGGPAIAHGMLFVGTGAGEYLPGNRLLAFGI